MTELSNRALKGAPVVAHVRDTLIPGLWKWCKKQNGGNTVKSGLYLIIKPPHPQREKHLCRNDSFHLRYRCNSHSVSYQIVMWTEEEERH